MYILVPRNSRADELWLQKQLMLATLLKENGDGGRFE
jgi:hypothetical protein